MEEALNLWDAPVCPICKGLGVRNVPSPNGGRGTEVCKCQRVSWTDPKLCPFCEGMGMRIVERADGGRLAEPCSCQHDRKLQALLAKAKIPKRYEECTFKNYNRSPGVSQAFIKAEGFVRIYPGERNGIGLLFTGPVGVGKTHLATAILRKLTLEKGVPCLFFDYRELLKQITNSYNREVHATELGVLKPVFDAEVLVLDELGAAKPTEWVWDTVALILNTRYNDRRTTILTTNYPNLPAGLMQSMEMTDSEVVRREAQDGLRPTAKEGRSVAGRSFVDDAASQALQATREETLGERIGHRMWSRLQEMCEPVKMHGPDYRQGPKRARFA